MNRQDSFVSYTHINGCYMKSTLDIHFHAARRVSFHDFLRKRFTANRAFNFGFCVVFVWCVTSFTSGGMTFYHRSGKICFFKFTNILLTYKEDQVIYFVLKSTNANYNNSLTNRCMMWKNLFKYQKNLRFLTFSWKLFPFFKNHFVQQKSLCSTSKICIKKYKTITNSKSLQK